MPTNVCTVIQANDICAALDDLDTVKLEIDDIFAMTHAEYENDTTGFADGIRKGLAKMKAGLDRAIAAAEDLTDDTLKDWGVTMNALNSYDPLRAD